MTRVQWFFLKEQNIRFSSFRFDFSDIFVWVFQRNLWILIVTYRWYYMVCCVHQYLKPLLKWSADLEGTIGMCPRPWKKLHTFIPSLHSPPPTPSSLSHLKYSTQTIIWGKNYNFSFSGVVLVRKFFGILCPFPYTKSWIRPLYWAYIHEPSPTVQTQRWKLSVDSLEMKKGERENGGGGGASSEYQPDDPMARPSPIIPLLSYAYRASG